MSKYNVFDVACYIINNSNENHPVTNLRLQKLLYFTQAGFLIKKHEPCFTEEIQAWTYGPVVPVVYQQFKRYGGLDIPHIDKYFKVDKKNILNSHFVKYDESIIPVPDKEIIDWVIQSFSEYPTMTLVEITHSQDPWKEAYKDNKGVITIDAIRRFFSVQG